MFMYMYCTTLGIVDMDLEDTLAIPALGQDPDLGRVLEAPSDAEVGEEAEEEEGHTENEDTLIVAHQVNLEAGVAVGTVVPRPAGDQEVGGAISPPRGQDDGRIPGVRVHDWIGQGQGQDHDPILGTGLVPIPEIGLGPIPEVLNHLLESRDRLLGLL